MAPADAGAWPTLAEGALTAGVEVSVPDVPAAEAAGLPDGAGVTDRRPDGAAGAVVDGAPAPVVAAVPAPWRCYTG